MKEFMVKNTRKDDLNMFMDLQQKTLLRHQAISLNCTVACVYHFGAENSVSDWISLFLPFLVIDMVVASVLMSFGMTC